MLQWSALEPIPFAGDKSTAIGAHGWHRAKHDPPVRTRMLQSIMMLAGANTTRPAISRCCEHDRAALDSARRRLSLETADWRQLGRRRR